MKHRHIAEADDPFGMLFQFFEVEFVYDTNGAVTAPCTENGFYGLIFQHLLKVGCPFFIRSSESKISFTDAAANLYMEPPFIYFEYRRLDVLCADVSSRATDADGITFF